MKKLFVFSVGLVSLISVSCRQNDDMLSNEDEITLKIIQNKTNTNKPTTIGGIKDTIVVSQLTSGGIVAPPR